MSDLLRPVAGLDDIFGAQAKALRQLQGRVLSLLADAGYEEVIPPLLERPDTLTFGAGRFLSGQTLIFNDPAGEGAIALRPDITPQIARIAATHLRSREVLRLCYSGSVLLARPDVHGSRQQWQTGIELLGVPAAQADGEALLLAAKLLAERGFSEPLLLVGHVALLDALLAPLLGNDFASKREAWFTLLARRSPEDLMAALHGITACPEQAALLVIVTGGGDEAWLQRSLGTINGAFDAAAQELLDLFGCVRGQVGALATVELDLALVPRFLYHSGVIFSAYSPDAPQALLHGGRYDGMMREHGRIMAATGFSFDLLGWIETSSQSPVISCADLFSN